MVDQRNVRAWESLVKPISRKVYPTIEKPGDRRIGHCIVTEQSKIHPIQREDIVIVGFPQDKGVELNSGRPGARRGPKEIRKALSRLVVPRWSLIQAANRIRIVDVGDVRVDCTIEESQERLGRVVARALEVGAFPIIIGGGHETAFGHFLGYVFAQRAVSIINLDAHLDLRTTDGIGSHSGSSFRQALEDEHGCLAEHGYLCVGVQKQANSMETFQFAEAHGVQWIDLEDVGKESLEETLERFCTDAGRADGGVMLTVDLDGIRQADAPGVSAPSPIGLTVQQATAIARFVGSRGASSFDISEYNPEYDRDGQTASVAALLIYEMVLTALSQRRSDD